MSFPFDPEEGLIVVPTLLSGPAGDTVGRLALDTGAEGSVVNRELAASLGYDLASAAEIVQITTGSRVESAPRIAIERIEALGQERRNFPVVCHTIPPSAGIDGVLGLDFFRGLRLVVDLREGFVSVE